VPSVIDGTCPLVASAQDEVALGDVQLGEPGGDDRTGNGGSWPWGGGASAANP
jgi:hypothetical protein